MKKVGIIGAGPSGICAIRHCIKEGFEVIAFEQNDEIGGEWNYTGAVGVNKFGIDTHSSIYDGLVTNLPKEVMAFPDFPFDSNEKESFLTPTKVQNYLLSYVDAFQLRQHIRFKHQVINVHPIAITEKWKVLVRSLSSESLKVFEFDFIFVCNGISVPLIPDIVGQHEFKGQVMHSHDYRNPKSFENEQVLVIGSGPSALDIVLQVGEVAKRVFWVHKIKEAYSIDINIKLAESVVQKSSELP
jgi:dimethylaniline monooxygenase (N-oxide forming)